MTVRTRFAPSPTGYLHIGGVRTALFNWLYARKHGGQFILRIDDTDAGRNVESALAPILHGLQWLGIDWDEGPDASGTPNGYFQSQRSAQYDAAVRRLLASGHAYRDYAKPEELQVEREAAEKAKETFVYSRKWMAETDADAARFESDGRAAVVRLKMPREGKLILQDQIRGQVEFEWAKEQDHVIQRADGTCLYHLANVVDDYDFQISHVIRAEEHLSNTPRQAFIVEALGYPRPAYAHLPFVAEPGSRNKLSKRKLDKYLKNRDFAQVCEHGRKIAEAMHLQVAAETFNPVIVDFYEQVGYLPDAIINYLVLLGWSLDDKTEMFSRAEMIEHFSLERVNKSPASFDPKKLMSFQERYMQNLSHPDKCERAWPFFQRANPTHGTSAESFKRFSKVVRALGDRLKVFGDIVVQGEFFLIPDDQLVYEPQVLEQLQTQEAIDILDSLRHELLAGTFPKDPVRKCVVAQLAGPSQGSSYDLAYVSQWIDREALSVKDETKSAFRALLLEESLKERVHRREERIGDYVRIIRGALTGQSVGPGLYESMHVLGRQSCIRRIDRALSVANKWALSKLGHAQTLDAPLKPHTLRLTAHEIYSGKLSVVFPENSFVLYNAKVTFLCDPKPIVEFRGKQREVHGFPTGDAIVKSHDNRLSARGIVTHVGMGFGNPTVVSGVFNDEVLIGEQRDLKYVDFHLPNFHTYIGDPVSEGLSSWAARLRLASSDWNVTIDAVRNPRRIQEKAQRQGIAITHVGRIERQDRSTFDWKDCRIVLQFLRQVLSFARGLWVSPLLSKGFDSNDKCVLEDFTAYIVDLWRSVPSWFPFSQPKCLGQIFGAFVDLQSNATTANALRHAIYWYLNSNVAERGIEANVVTAFIALESAAKALLAREHESNDSISMIRDALDSASVSFAIPQHFNALRARSDSSADALASLSMVRNAIVHPAFVESHDGGESGTAAYQARELAMWLVELLILRCLNYNGKIQSRIAAGAWQGQFEPVPWASSEPAK